MRGDHNRFDHQKKKSLKAVIMSNKRNPGKPRLKRGALNIYFTSSRLSTQPNLSLHNGFLSHPSMDVLLLLWLCVNGWHQATLEVLRPASTSPCGLDPTSE